MKKTDLISIALLGVTAALSAKTTLTASQLNARYRERSRPPLKASTVQARLAKRPDQIEVRAQRLAKQRLEARAVRERADEILAQNDGAPR